MNGAIKLGSVERKNCPKRVLTAGVHIGIKLGKTRRIKDSRRLKIMERKLQTITFKKLSHDAQLPTRHHTHDAGLDLYANETKELHFGLGQITIDTGVAVEIPEGFYGRIAPRSGLAARDGVDVLAGVVDHGYNGPVKVVLATFGNSIEIRKGDKIAQLIISPIETPVPVWGEELSDSDRGTNGFGSSGK